MALHFTSVAFREEPDFLPTTSELENVKRKIEEHDPGINNKKNKKDPYEHLFRKVKDTDEYDNLGRNITEQKWRQNKIPWTKVIYNKKFY